MHINCPELLAGTFAIKAFVKHRSNFQVFLKMDNHSAVAYVNRMRGTHSLNSPSLSPVAVVSPEGHASNSRAPTRYPEYHSRPGIKTDGNICRVDAPQGSIPENTTHFGSLPGGPICDHQLPEFISWKPDPFAQGTDTLQVDWKLLRGYAFPLFV